MARNKLTDTKVKNARPGWLGDGDGLWLRVSHTGARSWVFVVIRQGRRREMGLGAYGAGTGRVSLAAARVKADQVREILGRGGDPFTELPERKLRVRTRTFGELADEFIEVQGATWRNEKHREQWTMTLTEYASPMRKLSVASISTDDIVSVLRPIWRAKPETAARLRGRIERVLDYGKALNLREGENPARWRGHLDHILGPRLRLQRGHHSAMPYDDVPGFVARLREQGGVSARALEFLILTAARTTEVRLATPEEIDRDQALWTLPAARMKAGRTHEVPLCKRALELAADGKWLFPGPRAGAPLSVMALTSRMRRLGAGEFTVHGFRSAFRDWAGDHTNFAREIAEHALAHRVGNAAELAYRRGSALAKRRKLMEAWGRFIDVPTSQGVVIELKAVVR